MRRREVGDSAVALRYIEAHRRETARRLFIEVKRLCVVANNFASKNRNKSENPAVLFPFNVAYPANRLNKIALFCPVFLNMYCDSFQDL